MRLLDLVEEHDAVGPTTNSLSELTTLVIPNVARRRSHQTRCRMTLHELTHVEADHGVVIVEEELCQRACQLGLADPGWPEEHEATDRPLRVLESGTCAPNGLGDDLDRLILTNEPLVDLLLHLEELGGLLLDEAADGHAGPR